MPIPGPVPSFDLNASESASASGSGSTWYDLSGNNYNYTMTSPTFVAPTSSNPGYFEFPISNTVHPPVSYGTYTGTPAVTDTSWTVYAWVNYAGAGSTTNVARYPIFWNGIDPSVSTDGWNFQLTGPTQAPAGRLQLEGKTVGSTTNSTVVPADQWVQVAAKLNGSSGTFYINGTSVGTFSGFSFNTPTSAMFIEKTYNDSFPGNISIVRLYDTVLSDSDITNLYNYDLATYIAKTPFISYDISDNASYPGTGNTVYDLSGNNNDLTLYNGPTYGGTGSAKYIKFDGVNDYAVGLGFTGFGSGGTALKLTRYVWCQLDSVSATQWMTSLGYYGSPDFCVAEDLFDTVSSVWQWTPNFGANVSQINAGAVGQSVWVNLAYVYDTTNCYAYVNGVQVGTVSGVSKYFDLNAGFGLCVSGYIDKYTPTPNFNFGYPFDGKIAVLEYFNYAASPSDVLNYFNNTQARFLTPSPYQGLVGGRTFGSGFAG